LLVGPSGSNTVLMNYAGSGIPVSGLSLTFSSNAAGPVPALSALTSGTFLPSDYQPVKPYNFLTSGINNPTPPNPPPPAGPYPTNLNVFNGLNPNTNWNLYVQDNSAGDVGNITGGWTLQIFTQPIIQFTGLISITNVAGSASGKTTFIILDDSPAGAINYTTNSFGVTSSNTTLLPAANVTFSGSGTNWQVNFNPTLYATGSSLVTVYATNSYGQVASGSFLVVVTPANFPPVIYQPAAGSVITIQAGTPTQVTLGYSNTGYIASNLTVTAASAALGSQNPIPNSSLAFVGNGSGPSNLVITPAGNLTGSNLITLTVTQPGGGGLSTNGTFTVVVAPSTVPLFVNTNAITINTNSAATPYPSQITVSGVGGNILKVTVTLINFSHTFPSDVSALLVSPQGKSVMLMSTEGGGIGVSNLRLTFADSGGTMPAFGPLTSGTYAPTNSDLNSINGLADITNFTAQVAPPYGHALNVFTNTNPNGVWSLYVYDNNMPDTGVISGGWALSIQTIGPMITPLGPVTMSENTSITIPFSIASASTFASNITVTAAASGQVPANLVSSLVFTGAEQATRR
jgi:subtilisin-like proprotein convertase family protein